MLAMSESIATSIGRQKIDNAVAAGADGIVTACVFCDIQLTQVQFGDDAGKNKLPVITIPQFLGPALGLDDESLGFELNKISPTHIMESLQEVKQ